MNNSMTQVADDLSEIHNQCILIFSPSEWNDNAVSNMQIASQLSKRNKVVYFETIGGRMPKISEYGRVLKRIARFIFGKRMAGKNIGVERNNVQIVTPLAIPYYASSLVGMLNQIALTYQVRRAVKKYGISKPIVWNFSPNWSEVISQIPAALNVFHCVDALETYDATDRFRKALSNTINHADIIFTPNPLLHRRLSELNSNCHLVGHGCGLTHIQHPLRDLTTRSKERTAIYAGSLAGWVDFDLLIYLVFSLPDVKFMFLGRQHVSTPQQKLQLLQNTTNCSFMGYVKYENLPTFYREADIGLVPYNATDEHIKYSTPTKYLDYLAAGLPVISTDIPSANTFGTFVTTTDSYEGFKAQIEHILHNDSVEKIRGRRAFAMSKTWASQVNKMETILLEKTDYKML